MIWRRTVLRFISWKLRRIWIVSCWIVFVVTIFKSLFKWCASRIIISSKWTKNWVAVLDGCEWLRERVIKIERGKVTKWGTCGVYFVGKRNRNSWYRVIRFVAVNFFINSVDKIICGCTDLVWGVFFVIIFFWVNFIYYY